jgi:Family of unknown function (DUF5996)
MSKNCSPATRPQKPWPAVASFSVLPHHEPDVSTRAFAAEDKLSRIDPADHSPQSDHWPELAFEEWKDSCATLHMWMQIVGKIRLMRTPSINHSWHAALYVTARGLTTSPIPYGERTFEIEFDFIGHQLSIRTSDGHITTTQLGPRPVADFYADVLANLRHLGLDVKIHATPNEVIDAIPFNQDRVHATYDPEYANRLWRVLVQADRVFKQFRGRFIGKCSPVHFFWGSFDLAVTRFSGRTAPTHPGGVPNCPDRVMREAYSHELSSCGFWPGGGPVAYPVFYAYAYPEPQGFSSAPMRLGSGAYDTALHEFILPYDAVRQAPSPDALVLQFLQDSYEAAANCGRWDRSALERAPDVSGT